MANQGAFPQQEFSSSTRLVVLLEFYMRAMMRLFVLREGDVNGDQTYFIS